MENKPKKQETKATYEGMTKRHYKVKKAHTGTNSVKTSYKPPFFSIGGRGIKEDLGKKCPPPKCFKACRMNLIANSK